MDGHQATGSNREWTRRLTPQGAPDGLRLFCFPYAGAGASVFRGWSTDLPEGLEAYAVQLPGREDRFLEPAVADLGDLLDALAPALTPCLDRPFAFFGHSMGAVICWELARRLRDDAGLQPVRIIVSGSRALHYHESCPPDRLDLSEPALIDKLRRLNGTPRELLDSRQFRQTFLPAFRADVSLFAGYVHTGGEPLDCPVSAFGGTEDPRVREEHVRAWAELTTGSCEVTMFPGGHLFLNESRSSVVRSVARALGAARTATVF